MRSWGSTVLVWRVLYYGHGGTRALDVMRLGAPNPLSGSGPYWEGGGLHSPDPKPQYSSILPRCHTLGRVWGNSPVGWTLWHSDCCQMLLWSVQGSYGWVLQCCEDSKYFKSKVIYNRDRINLSMNAETWISSVSGRSPVSLSCNLGPKSPR